jgi:hypothetical protein
MSDYIREEDAAQYGLREVSCAIRGVFVPRATIIVVVGSAYLYQDVCDGDTPLAKTSPRLYGYRFSWKWDDQVDQVKLLNNKGASPHMSETTDILDKLKLVGLDEKVRILRKYGLVDADGQPTTKGQQAIWPLLFALVSDKLVDNIKEAEKLDRKEKKAKKEA